MELPPTVDPDDALSQPTRAQLFRLLGELKRPMATAELAQRLELHPNGIRLHLERLRQAGLVERASVPAGRGRPPDLWTIAPGARPGGGPPRAYQDLGRWLARAIGAWPSGTRSIEKAGRLIGRELGPEGAGADDMQTALTALGFQPIAQREGDQLTICLGNCPYRDAVHENQAAICALHKGMTRGLLDVLEPTAKLVAFVPHDPDAAGCVIQLRGVAEE
jgi:predicted ArsR family transcriptional regulator